MMKYLLPLILLLTACTEKQIVTTGTMPAPTGAIEYCKRHPEAEVCGNE